MYIQFIYKDGSNPYITTTTKNLFNMICKYELNQIGAYDFKVIWKRPKYKKTYEAIQGVLRDFAINWQQDFRYFGEKGFYSWGDVAFWGSFFEEYGKKYGLLREFRDNGII